MKLTNWEKLVIYKLRRTNLPWVFGTLPNSVAAALSIMKPKLPIRAVIEFDDIGKSMQSKKNSEPLISFFTTSKHAFLPKAAFHSVIGIELISVY